MRDELSDEVTVKVEPKVVKPTSQSEKAAPKIPRSIKFHDKHYYDSAAFSTAPNPLYSAVTYYNMPGFLIG